jgi:hypothetical protein
MINVYFLFKMVNYTMETINELINNSTSEKLNLKMLSKKYPNELGYHVYKTHPSSFRKGQEKGCRKCFHKRFADSKRHTTNVKNFLQKYDFELLSNYTQNNIKLKLKCKYGHIFEKCIDHIKRDQGCIKCKSNAPGRTEEICRNIIEGLLGKSSQKNHQNG